LWGQGWFREQQLRAHVRHHVGNVSYFASDGLGQPGWVCLRGAQEPVSGTYCCGVHIKHHLQIAPGRPLAVKLRSSALSSGGERPCAFYFSPTDQADGA